MSSSISILYVEDDETLSFIIKENLERKGYHVLHCENGKEGYNVFLENRIDLCIIDVMLPVMDGFTLARNIRQRDFEVPVLFVTAKSLLDDKIEGLTLGADDYIVKPFSIEELLLKIEVFLRRSRKDRMHKRIQGFDIGAYHLDLEDLTLRESENTIKLTRREADLVYYLYLNRNKLIQRREILINIWGADDYFAGRSLDVFISRLRKYLKKDPEIKIENRHSIGYIFRVPEV